MSEPIDTKLGFRFWFAIGVVALSVCAIVIGLYIERAISVFGGAFFVLLYGYEAIRRIRDVRLAKRLNQDPEMLRLYSTRPKQ